MQGRIRYMNDGTKKYYIYGKEVTEAEYAAAFPPVRSDSDKGIAGSSLVGWCPLRSESTAYHPSQVAEAKKFLESRGCPTEIDAKGRPIFRTRGHRRQFMKINRQHDNDGGYGDG